MRLRYLPLIIMAIFMALGACNTNCNAQVFNPVKWEFASKHIEGDKYEIQFIANIEPHWHLYSQKVGKNGPIPTSFVFAQSENYSLIGKTTESEGITQFEPMFKMEVTYFENKAVFTQKIKIKSKDAVFKGDLEFMACDDEKCLPPEIVDFQIPVVSNTSNAESEKSNPTAEASKAHPVAESIATSTSSQLASGNLTMAKSPNSNTQANPTEDTPNETHTDANSGILTPVTWASKAINHGDGTYTVSATATIDAHWHVYSKDLPKDDGPQATEFNILTKEGIELIGDVSEEGKLETEHDPNFDMVLNYYSNTVTLSQRIKPSADVKNVKAEVYFMTCNDQTCIPPEALEFDFDLANAEMGEPVASSSPELASEEKEEGKSLWTILALSILGGFGALLTPCVFPMIPMTVSFFTKQSKTKAEGIQKGVFYGLSIIGIYVLLSLPFHVFDSVSPDVFNEFSTNPYLNFSFFLIFIVFAISFLGAFEITMPSSWVNKADSASDKGGLVGVFFMAVTLILVSFSCTGPAIGLLLGSVLSSDGGATALTVGMFGFGLGIGLPFGLFAAFPGWLNSLPKSGGWLNTVKVVFGFVELAFAFKFLSNADLVLQLHIITREVFIAIWVGVFGAMAMYLFGLFQLPHDSPMDRLSVGRGIFATFTLVFAIYLLPGMWGAPLKLISGFPPPAFYSESPNGVGYKGGASIVSSSTSEIPKGTDPSHCPHNLNCFHDYETGLAYAREVNKPVLLDFTGWACVNCRRMEENVWSDPRVLEKLRNDYVLISLYVDEKQKLPKEEQFTSEITGKKVRTVGNKWSEFQIRKYQSNTQPYYVIIDHNESQLNEAAAYDPDIEKFANWLKRGKSSFEESK